MVRMKHDIRLYMCFQKPHVSYVNYYKTFKVIRGAMDIHGGGAGFHEGMFKEKLKDIKQ